MTYFFARDLYKNWGDLQVRFSCSLERGQMLGIVGRSGSGKSTVLRLISGLLTENFAKISPSQKPAETPRVFLDGRDISLLPPGKRNIGMVFQSPALFSHMRVDDNIAYGLRSGVATNKKILGKSESRLQATAFLENFGLAGFAARYPDSLSGGEAQRVSLARTLIVQPKLVLFDEPFSSLDAPLRKKLAADILALQQKIGFTGIMVSHDIQETKAMCNIITVMKDGSQIWSGRPSEFSEDMLG